MVGFGLLLASILAIREAKRRGIGGTRMYDYVLSAAATYFFFGRLPVIWSQYGLGWFIRPWVLLTELQSGIEPLFGLVGTIVFSLVFIGYYGLILGVFLDAITPSILLLQVFAALGSNLYGTETQVPWAVNFGELQVHPLPLYFALGYYTIFFFVWRLRKHTRFDGQLFLGYLPLWAWLHLLISFVSPQSHMLKPWIYGLVGVLFSLLWSNLFYNSRVYRHRRGLVGRISEVVIYILVIFIITIFFYSRFISV